MNVSAQVVRLPWWLTVIRWFDTYAGSPVDASDPKAQRIDWLRVVPFALLHLFGLAVFLPEVGMSTVAVTTAISLYVVRMFAITGFYHRYFSHRSFKANRFWQFVFAVIGNSSIQRGPLWWAAHHRHHHRTSDTPEDAHSPRQHGFLWAHCGWFLANANFHTRHDLIPDLGKFPELRLLDRFDVAVPILFLTSMYLFGWLAPTSWGTSGLQMLCWGCLSTVFVAHGTFCINSMSHVWGGKRFKTDDDSRNNMVLAIITMGEGWHNNHHHYQSSVRQSFRWYEWDPTFYTLWLMSKVGIVYDLKPVPAQLKRDA